jgi:hypothetical protein
VPALLDAGRRHHGLRPLIASAAGPLAGWLATQRADWAYAAPAGRPEATVDDPQAWELGSLARRVAFLRRLRRHDPTRARELLDAAWTTEAPDDRAHLLGALAIGLATADEPLLERALDDRRKQVRDVALELLGRLPDSAYAARMTARAAACVQPVGERSLVIEPPAACDRAMRRDGIAPRPPAGTGERAWWLEEILARTPLCAWPSPAELLARRVGGEWAATLRRGLARAAATQGVGAWASALVDLLAAEVAAAGRPDDRLLLEALYNALPVTDLATRAAGALSRGLAAARDVGVEQVLALCPRPWPPAVAEAVMSALEDYLGERGAAWRVAALCETAALRLPAGLAPRAVALARELRAARQNDPGVALVERFALTLRYRHDMLRELAAATPDHDTTQEPA